MPPPSLVNPRQVQRVQAATGNMADEQVPPFSIDKPRYDTSTYVGRWRKFAELVSPSWLFLSSEQIQHATQTLTDFRSGALVPGQFKDAELWKLRQAYESAVHPQTGETVPVAFRLSAFVPVNIPICVGMLLAPPTSYATATFVSCSTAVGLGKIVEKARGLSPGTRSFLGKGIDIMDEHGDVHGRSVAAGRQSLGQVALTRIALPMPILLLPPYLYEVMKKTKVMPKGKYPRLAAELGTSTRISQNAVALFPQIGTISADDVEEEFRSRVDRHGQPIRQFTYNKGI
ncbi:hypothetical protein BBJ28_00008583 [Nothophytophthora sp. Chile5]|nr:hypothetical protein BBJ28_00008583 [Nothophytophthora sp. Chile5]